MGENFLSLLGLEVTSRISVTNRIVLRSLKMSTVEKPLFSTEFPIMVRAPDFPKVVIRPPSPLPFLPCDRVRIPGKIPRGQQFHSRSEYALGIEDLSKTHSSLPGSKTCWNQP